MKPQDPHVLSISEVAGELRSWGGVAIVGAGLSVLAGMPLTSGLTSLLWYALDADPEALRDLECRLGRCATSAKSLIGDDPTAVSLAYQTVRCHQTAREAFQRGFVKRNEERCHLASAAHESLATLFHDNHIELIVSLNWDSLFESAYERLYGKKLRADSRYFFKPHGDVRVPTCQWILPGEEGHIPRELTARLAECVSEKPRLLIIAGYSEADELVVGTLIEPLSQRWRVVRIGPSATGELAIKLPADQGLPILLSSVVPRPAHSPWIPVRFNQHSDVGRAFAGEGLGPGDIDLLPALPEAQLAIARLNLAHRAVISGESGSGKSGTAYRVAQAFSNQGFEIVRLAELSHDMSRICGSLEGHRFPTLALVDDAHRLRPTDLAQLLDRSNENLKVLGVATTTEPVGPNDIRMDGGRAVSIVAKALSENRTQTLAYVRKLDSYVGDRYGQDALERRLEDASKEPFLWRFMFALTGGWNRIAQHSTQAKTLNRSDVLLFAIAVHQLLKEDGEPTTLDLTTAARAFGYDDEWVTTCLESLSRLRLITSHDHPKCLHLRHAHVIVRAFFKNYRDPLRKTAFSYVDSVVARSSHSLRGIYWLLEELRFADGLWGQRSTLFNSRTQEHLVARIFAATTPHERSVGCHLLDLLDEFLADFGQVLLAYRKDIIRFVDTADGISAWGLARFLNGIDRAHHNLINSVLAEVDARRFVHSLQNAKTEHLAGYADLLNRLAYVGRDEFATQIPKLWSHKKVHDRARAAAGTDIFAFATFVKAINYLDEPLAVGLVKANAGSLAAAFGEQPLETYELLSDVIWFTLSFDMGLGVVPAPNAERRKIAATLCKKIRATDCARLIEVGRMRDLERWARLLHFLHRADPPLAKRIVKDVSLSILDDWLAPFWKRPPTDLVHFVMMLRVPPSLHPAAGWIERHTDDLEHIPRRFAVIAPEACVAAMKRGAVLDYDGAFGLDWELTIGALARIAEVDRNVAAGSIRTQATPVARTLTTHQADLYEKSDRFLALMEDLVPGSRMVVANKIAPELAGKHWPQLHQGNAAQRRAFQTLMELATEAGGALLAAVAEAGSPRRKKRRASS